MKIQKLLPPTLLLLFLFFTTFLPAQELPKNFSAHGKNFSTEIVFLDDFNDGTKWTQINKKRIYEFKIGKKKTELKRGKLRLSNKSNYKFYSHQKINFNELKNFEIGVRFKFEPGKKGIHLTKESFKFSVLRIFHFKMKDENFSFLLYKKMDSIMKLDTSLIEHLNEKIVNLRVRKIGVFYTIHYNDALIFSGQTRNSKVNKKPRQMQFVIKSLALSFDQLYVAEFVESYEVPEPIVKPTATEKTPIAVESVSSSPALTPPSVPVATMTMPNESFEEADKKYHALIIGNNDYQDESLTDLDQPIIDAKKLYEVLTTKYVFDSSNVVLMFNASREDLIRELDRLSKDLTPNDNLIIFYAGHGYWNSEKETGYWLPVDANITVTSNWLRNSTMQEYIEDINAKHTLLITDACFGGGIFKTRAAFDDANRSINNLYRYPSRKAMTSGMLNEVPDRSVFMENLIERLNNNVEPYISSSNIFFQFRDNVMNNSNNAPQFGTIHNTGDKGGDFIFILK